ncbi:MAG: benzoyl-CoA-dihydrodiol lyase, partial [Proteobacteria bacterium]|nr:benzoyl-CoA-dihydrodiol lyase [Pseudomonadota bacterium]
AMVSGGPEEGPPSSVEGMIDRGAAFWPLRLARELDDAILHLRLNELEIGILIFKSHGDADRVLAHDGFLGRHGGHWLAREITLYWKRVLKRIDLTSRSLVAMIEPGSCFAGTLAEITFACDRSYMAIGQLDGGTCAEARLTLSSQNFGAYAMSNGLSRLETRFLGEPDSLEAARSAMGKSIPTEQAEALGLVTFAFDDIDWDDEIRLFLEERASFSPDGLTGLEANLRFAGPETMESKIFGRLTAWQNWIFQRSNAVGSDGALARYGSGRKPVYKFERI